MDLHNTDDAVTRRINDPGMASRPLGELYHLGRGQSVCCSHPIP